MSASLASTGAAGRDPAAEAPSSRVLVVHGDAAIRQELVRGLGYERLGIAQAADARAAIEAVGAEHFDLILLDMAVGGIQLLNLLKGDSRSSHIPVIMIVAAHDGDGVVDCLEAGADDFLSQPAHSMVLRIRVTAVLEKKRLRDSDKALHEQLASTRRSHDRVIQKMLAAHKLEFVQLQETIKALRKQLDATSATAKASVETARASAAAELRQLRATIRALREQVDLLVGLQSAPTGVPNQLEQQASDGR